MAKTVAAETRRRRRQRRGGAAAGGAVRQRGGTFGGGGGKGRRGRRDDFVAGSDDDDDDEEDYYHEEEEDEDDGFIVHSDDDDDDAAESLEEEGDWNSDLEDDEDGDGDDSVRGRKKAGGTSSRGGTTKSKSESKTKQKPKPTTTKGSDKKKGMKTRPARSKYFAGAEDDDDNHDDDDDVREEKKDDDDDRWKPNQFRAVTTLQPATGGNFKRRRILEDSSSEDDDDDDDDDDENEKGNRRDNSESDDDSDRALLQTVPFPGRPATLRRPHGTKNGSKNGNGKGDSTQKRIRPSHHDDIHSSHHHNNDDDDDEDLALAEALAISKAEHDSLLEHTPDKQTDRAFDKETKRKRLKKTNRMSSSSMLEDLVTLSNRRAQPKTKTTTQTKTKKKKKKKGEIELPIDSEEEEIIQDDEDDDADDDEDDEDDVYEINEEEQTAAQVLREANALSAKIVHIVSGWCGGNERAVQGLIVGKEEGALGMGGASAFGPLANKHKHSNSNRNADGDPDAMWISKEVMSDILPKVELAEYQLLGVNWMALLNRLTFGGKTNEKTKHRKNHGKKNGRGLTVNGILADEMGLGKTVQTIAFLAWLNHQKRGSQPKAKGGSKAGDAIEIDDDAANTNPQTFHVDDSDADDLPSASPSSDSNHTRRPHLIVVPASVLSNWLNEFRKFAPHMKVVKYHGSLAEREEIQEQLRASLPDAKNRRFLKTQPLDVVLTTFSYFSSEKSDDRSFLKKFHFDYLVVDEGHTLKNPKGLRYRNLDKFKTSHRLLLTGTPVQNSPKELMSLLCFLMPLFQTKTKAKKRKNRMDDDDDDNDGGERMLEHFVQLEGGADGDEKAYRKLKQLFAPFVLRRKKDDVLSMIMPPKIRKVDLVQMDEASRSIYDSIISNHVKARNKETTSKSSEVAAQKNLFTALRKAANHPLLLRTRHTDEKDADTLARLLFSYGYFGSDATCTLQLVKNELANFSDYDIHCAALTMIEENPKRSEFLEKYTLAVEDLFCSSKFVRLRTLLPQLINGGHRILIFSQWTRVLDLMNNLMESLEIKFLRLDGSTAVSERQALIDEFTNDPTIPVFLLSTRAGGMGLNLTAADTCILHDLDFNPFNDRQAEDRCHRIGQKKPVTIIKMVTQGTVDEDIYSVQERKAKMNEAIMEEKGGKKKKSSKSDESEEIARIMNAAVDRFLKSPTRQSDVLTQPVINVDD